MPIYTIRDPETGQVLKIRGDQPPTDQEIEELFNVQRSKAINAPDPNFGKLRTPPKPPSPSDYEDRSLGEQAGEAVATTIPTVDQAVDTLPAVGAGVGGGLASPGVITTPAGAAFGAASGESLRQLINRARGKGGPATPTDAALSIGGQGVLGALTEGIPIATRGVSRGLYSSALKGGDEALREAYPGIVQRGIDEGLPVTRGGTRQAAKIGSELVERAKKPVSNFLGKSGKAKLTASGEEAQALAETMRGARAASSSGAISAAELLKLLGFGGSGAAIGTAMAGPAGGVVGGALGTGIEKAVSSPAVRSGAAIALDRIAPGLAPMARIALLKLLGENDSAPQQ